MKQSVSRVSKTKGMVVCIVKLTYHTPYEARTRTRVRRAVGTREDNRIKSYGTITGLTKRERTRAKSLLGLLRHVHTSAKRMLRLLEAIHNEGGSHENSPHRLGA